MRLQLLTDRSCPQFMASIRQNLSAPRLTRPFKPLRIPHGRSLLPLVNSCNNLVLPRVPLQRQEPCSLIYRASESGNSAFNHEVVVPFQLSKEHHHEPLGYLRAQVADAIEKDHEKHLILGSASPWNLTYSKHNFHKLHSVAFAEWVNEGGKYTRTMHIERIVHDWKKHGLFSDVLQGWPGSDEAYPVYKHTPKHITANDDPLAFAIERAALPLFSLVHFGTLLIGYLEDPATGLIKLSISRRSKQKKTWPGVFDVTVSGGMGLGETSLDRITQASTKKALLDQDYVENFARPVGALSCLHRPPNGWVLPSLYFLYDLPLIPEGSNLPKRNVLHGVVDTFQLMDVEMVLRCLLDDLFKPSSALAIIYFLIRHGYLTEESDPRYLDICRSLNMGIDLPLGWTTHR